MKSYQTAFIELALANQVLTFGEFTLKSGRVSPYFFNLGRIAGGAGMRRLGEAYAQALAAAGVEYDMLFGPAYKGIPLVTAVATALAGPDAGGRDVPFAYNRKEAKDHGEGGTLAVSCSISCTAERPLAPFSCRSSAMTAATGSAPAARSNPTASLSAVPAVSTSSTMTTRPRGGAPTSVPPSP